MTETLCQRAVMSAFQYQVDRGMAEPETQLKTVERRLRVIVARKKEEAASFESLIGVLTQGLCVQFGERAFVAQLDELQTIPAGGLVKRLESGVDKKTKNPKTSRGTVWRRNSTVKERRRPAPNWNLGSIAKTEAKRKTTVRLIPYEVWLGAAEQQQSQAKQLANEVIQGKRLQRSQKQILQQEMQRRTESRLSIEEIVATECLEKIKSLSERNGIANEEELYRRIVMSLQQNQPLPFLFIWGPPYAGQGKDLELFTTDTPENAMAIEIEQVIQELSQTGVIVQPLLLFADVYGTQINGMAQSEVQTYLDALKNRFATTAQVLPWSAVKDENNQRYVELADRVRPQSEKITEENIRNATLVQSKLGKTVTPSEAKELVRRYKTERFIEGQLLTEGFLYQGEMIQNVVKLGTAPSRFKNDEPYEISLPRIYIKNMTRAAWNKSR